MVKLEKLNFETKKQQYNFIATKMTALVSTESDFIANMANGAALLWNILKDINWSGFYLWNEDNKELVLAPFCGMPACTRLKDGKGVCNAAVIARAVVCRHNFRLRNAFKVVFVRQSPQIIFRFVGVASL